MNRDEIIELDHRHVWHPYTAMDRYFAEDPIVVERAEGSYLFDADGTRYLDGNGSWWVSTLGHRHPRLVQALLRQTESLPHASLAGCTHETAARLASELAQIAPGAGVASLPAHRRLTRVFFSDDGSTAVEVALKMAAQYWAQNGRPSRTRFVAVRSAFHGETVGAVSLSGLPVFRSIFGPLLFDVVHVRSPAEEGGWERAAEELAEVLKARGDAIAGVVLEPLLQGAGGMLPHPAAYVRAAREATLRAETLLIADEVFTGLGRLGAWTACERAGVVPDLLCLAKALSGGLLPFAATLASEQLFDGFRGTKERAFLYGHSYAGNPLGAAVAREVLAIYQDQNVLAQVERSAAQIAQRFAGWGELKGVRHPRSLGMVGALDLGGEGYLGERGWQVYRAARRRGLYLRPLGDTLYIAPALNTAPEILTELLDGVEAALRETLAS